MSYLVYVMLLMFLALMGQVSDASKRKFSGSDASAFGNVIIGGLFPFHNGVNKPFVLSQPQEYSCANFSTTGLTQSLAMIHAIEVVNKSPLLTGLGVTLGYEIHDTCSDVTTALRATEGFMQENLDCYSTTNVSNMSGCSQPTAAVIGAYNSEMSIAVARELNLEEIPQVSYASTADILSDKSRFPGFFRTIPSSMHQTDAMVKLLRENKWTWVGVITTDGDYGRSALNSFMSQAFQAGICLAFTEILPDSITNTPRLRLAVRRTTQTLYSNTRVNVVVSFAKPMHMSLLFRELLHSGLSTFPKLWVASNNWSTSQEVASPAMLSLIGWVVGFSFESRDVTSFQEFLKNLEFDREAQTKNRFLKDYYSNNKEKATEMLINSIDTGTVFSIQMAVNAIAQAVAKWCNNSNCTNPGSLQPWELLQELRKSTFMMDGESYSFDENGDITLGYRICLWKTAGQTVQTNNVVSVYHQQNASLTVTKLNLKITSTCSDSCRPGQFKKSADGQHTCCYSCMDCAENQYSNRTDMDQCFLCNSNLEWAEPGSSACKPKTLEYFGWNDGFAVLLLTLAAVGIVVVFLVSFLFLWHHHSPVVKAAGGPLCQLILFSLVGSFISCIFFVGQPTDAQCKVRQVLYGLSCTLCVSCILVKSLKILLAFQMKLALLKPLLSKIYKPYLIVCFCMFVQGANHIWWLILFSPHKTFIINNSTILEECDEGSYLAFGVVLGFTALLALICFICAFQGRKLPQKYNEAKFITFGMLVYLMAWVLFIPIYVTTEGKYLPAVEMVVILISSYSILSCHFFPKCYAILFRSMSNTRDDFMRNVYEYSKKSTRGFGELSLPETLKNVQNPYSISNLPHFFPKCTESEQSLEPTASPAISWKRATHKRTLSI